MINLQEINGFETGRRDSFEALVKVLARREPPENAHEFQPNDGRGGDGGVEAIWLLNNDDKIGYQSKFFETLGDTQWKQMDKSVAQALKTHPELKRYVFALPLDFTPKRGPKAKGKSQQEKWDDRVATWKALASKSSISIEFECWGATVLNDKLLVNDNLALQRFWFGGDVLDDTWFSSQVEAATLKLDDRFNPEDHVEVSIEAMFDAIVRGPKSRARLHDAFTFLASNRVPSIEFTTTPLAPDPEVLAGAQSLWSELVEMQALIDQEPTIKWNLAKAKETLDELHKLAWKLERPFSSTDSKSLEEAEKQKFTVVKDSLSKLQTALATLDDALRQRDWAAETAKSAIVLGEAGSGKSHSLGQAASQRVQDGLPTVVILGQDLSDAPFWPQLGGLLGLEAKTSDEILGVLDAAGSRKGKRTLLFFDAINEGAGATYWMHWIPQVIDALRPYPYIAAVFSCRDVYSKYAIPENLLKAVPVFSMHGFFSLEERERAAIQYLDNKGISRPNTPWLSPEFTNPLFLRTTSEALLERGESEFPRGLQGVSELMAFYLDGIASRTGVRSVRPEDLSSSLKRFVQRIATAMAANGQDFVELEVASDLAHEQFGSRQAPEGKSWLDVFIQSSLFRRDPPPYSKNIDPLNPPSELIRFSFQRFQDYLMADALAEKVVAARASASANSWSITKLARKLLERIGIQKPRSQSGAEFNAGGPLNFLFYEGDTFRQIRYEYSGLIGALSTIYPEKLGTEFAIEVPDWKRHWEDGTLQQGFAESFKWRKLEAFTNDARDLLNTLDGYSVDPQGLLLDVSITIDHPYNAKFLNAHLQSFGMAERDSHWTNWINWASKEEFSQIDRIISWAMSTKDRKTDARHMELASLILAWSLSSSHITLRDRSTKALTSLFLARPDVFTFVFEEMHSCNDPYVVERLYAAAFGACCIDPSVERLRTYSSLVFAKAFAEGTPPVSLMTRDYALGIVELASHKNALVTGAKLENCYYPFGSEEPIFGLTKEQVEKIADSRGGKSIFRSASSEWGDYGKYSIPGRVRGFLTTRLSEPKPVSASEVKDRFKAEFIDPYPERVAALEAYEQASIVPIDIILRTIVDRDGVEAEEETIRLDFEKKDTGISKEDALAELNELLNAEERKRLVDEYFNDTAGNGDYETISVQQCRLWITKRAYELGWTEELFPKDGQGGSYSRHENDLERIGKKYQRIALDEFQARLADNFWVLEGWPERPHQYRYSHHEFRRNIEPTILPTATRYPPAPHANIDWISEPQIVLPEVVEEKLKEWPFTEDPTQAISDKLVRVDENKRRWLVLYEFNLAEADYAKPRPGDHGKRYEEFRFFYCVFVRKGKATDFTDYLAAEASLSVNDFQPREFTDGPFLREAFWRETWKSVKFDQHIWKAPSDCEFAIPIAHYHWESHLDKTLPEDFTNYMPQKWFAEELGLTMSSEGPQCWIDSAGNTVVKSQRPVSHQTAVVIDEATLRRYAEESPIEPVWIMIAERNTWPRGVNNESCWRRSEGAVWFDGNDWKQVGWNNDTKR